MKKTFKFFMCAAIVAAGFTACSEEVTPVPNDGGGDKTEVPGEVGESTFATFRFDNSVKSKALTSDEESAANTSLSELRVFIYSGSSIADDAMPQIDTTVTSKNDVTIYLPTSGAKKIFVVANDKTPNLPTKGSTNVEYKKFIDHIVDVKTDMAELSKLRQTSGDKLFMLSNRLDSCNFTLVAGVKEDESKVTSSQNYVEIGVRRAIAKVTVTQKAVSMDTEDGKGTISGTPEYRMWNINKDVYTIFRGYSPNGGTLTDTTNAKNYFGYRVGLTGSNPFISIPTSTSMPAQGNGAYYYVTENTQNLQTFGNTTYAAIKVTYTPKGGQHISDITSFTNVGNTFVATANAAAPTGTTFYRLDSIANGYNGLVLNTLFTDVKAVRQIVYHFVNPGLVALETNTTNLNSITTEQIAKYFSTYADGKAWYRLNIGEGDYVASQEAQPDFKFGVERNSYYWAVINGYGTLGEPKEEDLIGDIDKPIEEGPTYLTVSVKVLPWEAKSATVIL